MVFKLYELLGFWRFSDESKAPTMKMYFLAFALLGSLTLTAQNRSNAFIQSRAFHNPNSKYLPTLDAGVGVSRNFSLTKSLALNLGGALNYSGYKNQNGEETGTAFISFFKRSEIHYFDHWNVRQFCIETPVALQLRIAPKISLIGGLSPQFLAHVRIKGNSFNETVEISGSPLLSIKHDSDFDVLQNARFPVLNDVLFKSGLQFKPIFGGRKTIILESGIEYSAYGNSLGGYLKTGWQF